MGRFHHWQSNWLCARWLPPTWGFAPSHLPPGGRYKRSLLQGNDTGRVREVTIRRKPPCEIDTGGTPGACQRGLTFLLRQESKQRSRLKGGITRSRSNYSPLENPPGGTIGRLTLRFGSGWYVLATAPVLGCDFWGASFPRCRLKAEKSPVSHNETIPGAKRLPCQRELAKIFDF